MIDLLKEFLKDKEAREFFITGGAGTGKTYNLDLILEYVRSQNIDYTVCAYTHTACKVVAKALGEDFNSLDKESRIQTLHSYLKKRPGLNDEAKHVGAINISVKSGDSERLPLVIIDEFSFVGEKDYLDLLEMYDAVEDDEGNISNNATIKVIYVGDPNQLPPVQDQQTIEPRGKYHIKLNKVYRTDKTGLLDIMIKLQGFIEGKEFKPLNSNESFIRDVDIKDLYLKSKSKSKVLLSWTNKSVQDNNIVIKGRDFPEPGDIVLGARHSKYTVIDIVDKEFVTEIEIFGGILNLDDKFKTLQYLKSLPYTSFLGVQDYKGELKTICTLFGSSNYNLLIKDLQLEAVSCNKAIESISKGIKASDWCRLNPTHGLKKRRASAWRELLAIKNCTMSVDFFDCMTVHKSQGMTYEEVYIDAIDLIKCRKKNPLLFLKLYYVAVSRASNMVYTN